MAGRRPKLTYRSLRRIDAWFAERPWSVAVMARILRVSTRTVYDAANRRRAYAGCEK
jgi:hypothetical protein